MIPWMYMTFSFIEPQAFPSYSVIPYSLCSDQTTLECHSGNFGSITGSKKKKQQGREVNTFPGMSQGSLAPRQVEPY